MILLNYITIIIGSICAFKALKKVISSNYSLLHLCTILFFVIQIVPLIIDGFYDISEIERRTPYEYIAMTDPTTSTIYDIFCIISILLLLLLGDRYARYSNKIQISKNISNNNTLRVLFSVLAFIPIVGILLAPEPNVYFTFSYFYTHSYTVTSAFYHNHVMLYFNYIAFFSIICYYYLNNGRKYCGLVTLLSSFIVVWVDGKRGFLAMFIVAVILIDFIRKRYANNKQLIRKAILLVIVFLSYFAVYSVRTNKSTDDSTYITYNAYFSRETEVKMAIYSRLDGNTKMIPYDGATLLYDVTAFVPRSLWSEKPYGFFNYLTSYAYFGNGENFLSSSNFQVNIWSEFIANIGLVGYLLSVLFVLFIVRKSERSQNKALNLLGGTFVLIYMFLGFEMIVMLTFYLWVYVYLRPTSSKLANN